MISPPWTRKPVIDAQQHDVSQGRRGPLPTSDGRNLVTVEIPNDAQRGLAIDDPGGGITDDDSLSLLDEEAAVLTVILACSFVTTR